MMGVKAPLAERMRPRSLTDFVGQRHLLGKGKVLNRVVCSGRPQSFIFWGPPGCGKTTLGYLLARHLNTHMIAISAVWAGTREIRAAYDEAQKIWREKKITTWLLVDEIHRLNKVQQDTLLPYLERGELLLIGATTENPSFQLTRPLLSRARVLVFHPLDAEDLRVIIHRALKDEKRGLGEFSANLDKEAEDFLISISGGDARILLNILEIAVMSTPPSATGSRDVTKEILKDVIQKPPAHYDKRGDEHFNLLSAFHKSLRGGDPDAALYWFARMLEAGEDMLVIARRLVTAASEDVGLADPFALTHAISALQAYQFLGSPEGELAIAQAIIYVALAPKSNSVFTALKSAREAARKTGDLGVPLHLRNAPTPFLKGLGYGRDYRYSHDDPRGWTEQEYLPEGLKKAVFYYPKEHGWEIRWKEYLQKKREPTGAVESK